MKKEITGLVSFLILLLLICSGIFSDIVNFFAWLFVLQNSSLDTSIVGGIIVRILTFIVAYGLVRIIFKYIGQFNSKIMSIVYFIISTIIGFVLSYIFMIIEEYILIIGIVLGTISISIILYFIIEKCIENHRRKDIKNDKGV